MKNKEKIAIAMQRVQANLEERRITVNAPDGSVRVVMNAKSKIESITFAPEALAAAASDAMAKERLERMIAGAISAAQARVVEILKAEIDREAKDLGVPELADSGVISKLLGGM
ncbi:MAG: YbaB/EbfC family nucleoid-associated protein [Phycisphaerales bacterium]|nr:YbaB/EbfC family nucleoid-associated protein [Phycisphaerales bacterium]